MQSAWDWVKRQPPYTVSDPQEGSGDKTSPVLSNQSHILVRTPLPIMKPEYCCTDLFDVGSCVFLSTGKFLSFPPICLDLSQHISSRRISQSSSAQGKNGFLINWPIPAASSLTLRDHFSMDTVPESLWNDMKKAFQDYYYQVAGLPEYISTAPMKIRKAMVETLDKVRVTKYCTFPS